MSKREKWFSVVGWMATSEQRVCAHVLAPDAVEAENRERDNGAYEGDRLMVCGVFRGKLTSEDEKILIGD